jgi:hypothetical protein
MHDPVERQLTAYNAHDLDAFVSCFAEDVVVASPDGSVQMAGHVQMRAQYATLFGHRDVHAEVVTRVRAGDWVVDHERVTRPGMSLEVLVAYEVSGNRITRMITLR